MKCHECDRNDSHEDWCYNHPKRQAKRVDARADVAKHIDGCGYSLDAATVWPFYKAPPCMRSWDLSSQDDADWIAIFPPNFPCAWWAEIGTAFGCFNVESIELPNGWEMRVGFHS